MRAFRARRRAGSFRFSRTRPNAMLSITTRANPVRSHIKLRPPQLNGRRPAEGAMSLFGGLWVRERDEGFGAVEIESVALLCRAEVAQL